MKITLKTKDFISFLKLFEPTDIIDGIALGDTLYKKEGYIDKSILKENHTVERILNLKYDFKGLISFEGKINGLQIILKSRIGENLEFEIESTKLNLKKLENKIIEHNAYDPNIFDLKYKKEYN